MKKIVIIEDHPVLISIYRNKFIAEGFQVEIASDGELGLELVNQILPDLVVLDLAMPKLNGIEVLKMLRANPLFQSLPVIIFSDSAWKQQAWREGATVVLSKSIHSASQVVEAAHKALLSGESQDEENAAINEGFLTGASAFSVDATPGPQTDAQVLLVEDHHDVRSTIAAALDKSGFRVKGVSTHAAAVQEIESTDFDVILLNRLCPDGIGLSLSNKLRTLYPHKPIVMYSTAPLPITQEQRLQAGASAYLTAAEEILNPGPILLELINQAKTSLRHSESMDELLIA